VPVDAPCVPRIGDRVALVADERLPME
jgi:hypothetical protein